MGSETGSQGVDPVRDVGETAALVAAVHELDVLAMQDIADELGQDTRAAFLGLQDVVELGADPVERPEEGEVEPLLLAVGVDHAIEQLLAAGVDPALFVNRAEHQARIFLIENRIIAHAVHLGG